MHTVIAVCPQCSNIGYRSIRPLGPKETPSPDLFAPVDGAPPLDLTSPKAPPCGACGADLVFRREPDARTTAPQNGSSGGVTTLFEASRDETIVSMKEVAPDVYVAVTSRRIVKVDLRDILAEAHP